MTHTKPPMRQTANGVNLSGYAAGIVADLLISDLLEHAASEYRSPINRSELPELSDKSWDYIVELLERRLAATRRDIAYACKKYDINADLMMACLS